MSLFPARKAVVSALAALFFLFFAFTLQAQEKSTKPKTGDQPKPAAGSSSSSPAPLTGDEILKRVQQAQSSESNDAIIQMTLIDKNGIEQVKRFRIQRYKNNVLIRFLDPPDIKDTGYLILGDEEGNSQVYVYFPPPTDDYRQINVEEEGSNQSFLGSDFDITDFQIRNPEETVNKYIKTETLGGGKNGASIQYHVVESIPKDPNYKYGKIITWVRSDYWIPIRIIFYDRQGRMVKDMKVRSFKSVGERKIASKTEMKNLTNDHRTILEVEKIQFDVTFPDDNFTIRRLINP